MPVNSPRQMRSRAVVAIALALLAGCNELVDPWTDDTVGPDLVTTASVDGAQKTDTRQRDVAREFASTPLTPQDGTVSHYPLWWHDPYEDNGSSDQRFAWTWGDYVLMPFGLSRFIVNTIGSPITMGVYPPVPLRASDGVASQEGWAAQQDARWLPSGGSPTPPDILEVGAVPQSGK